MRQYLFPAILALTLHSLLLGIFLPHRPFTPPKLPGIPVEIAIRQPTAKPAATKKETATQPAARPATTPPPKEKKKPVPKPQPPKPAISKKPAEIKNAPLAAPQKESKIKKQREEAQPGPPAPPSPATAPAKEPAQAVEPAYSNVRAEADESVTATPAPPVRRQLAVPAYQRNRQPEYPPMARRRGYSGTVMLKVLVDAQGQVADLTVEKSSGHHILDEEALKAVRQWLFSPATEDGTPVSMWVSVPITFRLQDQ